MTADKLITLLDAQIARLTKLDTEPVGGFFMVVPPSDETTVLAEMFLGDGPSTSAFYAYLLEKLKESQKPSGNEPYIGIGAGRR